MKLIKKTMLIRKILGFFILWSILIGVHSLIFILAPKFLVELPLVLLIFSLTFIYIPFYLITLLILILYAYNFIWLDIIMLSRLTSTEWKYVNIKNLW